MYSNQSSIQLYIIHSKQQVGFCFTVLFDWVHILYKNNLSVTLVLLIYYWTQPHKHFNNVHYKYEWYCMASVMKKDIVDPKKNKCKIWAVEMTYTGLRDVSLENILCHHIMSFTLCFSSPPCIRLSSNSCAFREI